LQTTIELPLLPCLPIFTSYKEFSQLYVLPFQLVFTIKTEKMSLDCFVLTFLGLNFLYGYHLSKLRIWMIPSMILSILFIYY